MITFYDIPCNIPGVKTWSPNLWKTRYVLNYKGIPHKTVWCEYPDIEGICKKESIPPTGKRPDGSDLYTVPAIIDDSTGAKVADSIKIAAYLDKAYPNTPKVFPGDSEVLQHSFYDQFYAAIAPVWPTLLPKIPPILNEGTNTWYYNSRSRMFGKPLEQVAPVGEARVQTFKKVREAFDKFDGYLQKNSGGPFVMGETVSFADFTVGAVIQGFKVIWGEGSDEWNDFKTWSGGRWFKLFESLEKYAGFEN